MNLKTIFWPWGRIKDLEAANTRLNEELDDLVEENTDLFRDLLRKTETSVLLAREFGIAIVALTDIDLAVSGVKAPNGTTKKIGKIVSEANDLLITKVGSDSAEVARKCKAAERASVEAQTKADTEAETPADEVGNDTEEAGRRKPRT